MNYPPKNSAFERTIEMLQPFKAHPLENRRECLNHLIAYQHCIVLQPLPFLSRVQSIVSTYGHQSEDMDSTRTECLYNTDDVWNCGAEEVI